MLKVLIGAVMQNHAHDPHHSFSIAYAEKYGILEAIFIHHFQHWIRVNKRLKRNLQEGKTWTYQTIEVFQAHFSYLTYKQVRKVLDSLVKQGVIIKGNFNQKKYDRTCWYAFENDTFTCSTLEICPNGQMEMPEKANGDAQIGRPIPDDKDRSIKTDNNIVGAGAPVASADAERLYNKFLQKLNNINPKRKAETKAEREKGIKTIDLMMRADNRSIEDMEAIIEWFATNSFWSGPIESAASLRRNFDKMYKQMRPPETQETTNRKFAQEVIERYPDEFKAFKIYKLYVINVTNQKEIYFSNHSPDQFQKLLLDLADMEIA